MKVKLKWVSEETYIAKKYCIYSHYSLYASVWMLHEDVHFHIVEDDDKSNSYGIARKDGNKTQDFGGSYALVICYQVVYLSKELFDEVTSVIIQINNELNQEI